MKKAIIIIAIVATAAAFAQELDVKALQSLDLNALKEDFGLNAENSDEVKAMQLNPATQDAEAAGRKYMEAEADKPDSAIGVIVRLPQPTEAEAAALEADMSAVAAPDVDMSQYPEPTGDKTPNLAEAAVSIWVAGEITKDARSQMSYLDGQEPGKKCYGQVQHRVRSSNSFGRWKTVMVDVELPCRPDPDTSRVCYTTGTYTEVGYWTSGNGGGGGNDSGGSGAGSGRSFRDNSGDSGDRGGDNGSVWVPARTITVQNVAVACAVEPDDFLSKAKIFAGQEESCYEPRVGFSSCDIKASVSAKYECSDTGKQFADYNACSSSCGDSICKKVQDYDDPKLERLGIDFTDLSGAGDTEKRLAVGKALGACRQYRTKDKEVGPFDTKVGEYRYSCCYSSGVSMELSAVIKAQLGLPNNCEGIPLADLEKVNFNDPAIIGVMERQTGKLMDQNMMNGIGDKYGQMSHDDANAESSAQDAESRINQYKQRIPSL